MKQLEYINYIKSNIENSNKIALSDYFTPYYGWIWNITIIKKLDINKKMYLEISKIAYHILAVHFGNSTFSDSDLNYSKLKREKFFSFLEREIKLLVFR